MTNRNKKLTNNNKFNRRKEINKMKTRIFTICIMVAALAMFATGANADFKVIGGGWIPVEDSKASFGLQLKCDDYATCFGNVQYNDRYNNIKIHSTDVEVVTANVDDYPKQVWLTGGCRIQSKGFEDEYGQFALWLEIGEENWEELFMIMIDDRYVSSEDYSLVTLGGGNISIQVK